MFDEYRQKLSGLLDAMPLVQLLRGEAKVSPEGLQQSLLGMKPFQPPSESEAMNYMNAMTPIGLLGTFAGVGAKTANKALLDAAKKLDASGVDRTKIWNETGWFRGPDKKWRFEISDESARIKPIPDSISTGFEQAKNAGKNWDKLSWEEKQPFIKLAEKQNQLNFESPPTYPLGDLLSHEDLMKAYPSTKDIKAGKMQGWAFGGYYPDTDMIRYGGGPPVVGTPDNKSVVLHELQHAIQQREGFARGGSPLSVDASDVVAEHKALMNKELEPIRAAMDSIRAENGPNVFKWSQKALADHKALKQQADAIQQRWMGKDAEVEAYRRLAGEAEARAVQSRMDFDAAKRKAIPPWESYDIPWDQLIVR